jgi:hypothetical protein
LQGEGQEFESPRLHHHADLPPTRLRRSTDPCPPSEVTDQRIAGETRPRRASEAPRGRTLPTGYVKNGRRRSQLIFDFAVLSRRNPDSQSSMTSGSAAGGGQATQGTRWMPWRQEPMKDAAGCEKLRGVASRRYIRRCPNGETRLEKSSHSWLNQIGQVEVSQRTETSQ